MKIEMKELVVMRDEVGNQITLTKEKSLGLGWVADIESTYGDTQFGAKAFHRKDQAVRWARNKFAELEREIYRD